LTPDESPGYKAARMPHTAKANVSTLREYAERLVRQGHAYYAFDTPEELEQNRKEIPNFQYGRFSEWLAQLTFIKKSHQVMNCLMRKPRINPY